MGRRCSVCAHPQVDEINRMLAAGRPLTDIITIHTDITKMSLIRHRSNHLGSKDVLSPGARDVRNAYHREYGQGMSAEARAAKNAAYKEWKRQNPDKVREYNIRYWEKRAAREVQMTDKAVRA